MIAALGRIWPVHFIENIDISPPAGTNSPFDAVGLVDIAADSPVLFERLTGGALPSQHGLPLVPNHYAFDRRATLA